MIETIASILKNKGHGIYSVVPNATVHDAIAIMAEKGVAVLLVLAEGRLAGIVSAKDYGSRSFFWDVPQQIHAFRRP